MLNEVMSKIVNTFSLEMETSFQMRLLEHTVRSMVNTTRSQFLFFLENFSSLFFGTNAEG